MWIVFSLSKPKLRSPLLCALLGVASRLLVRANSISLLIGGYKNLGLEALYIVHKILCGRTDKSMELAHVSEKTNIVTLKLVMKESGHA